MGGGASKSDSCAAMLFACWLDAGSGLSYNHVLTTSKRAPEAMASREANFGTASHMLAASDNSFSRAAITAITRLANHGRSSAVYEATPLKISRVASRSCAASWQLAQVAMWVCAAADTASVSSLMLTASGRAAAESSSKSRNFLHSSSFFSRFHIPVSSLLLLSSSIPTFLRLAYHPAPGTKESDFHRVAIQVQNFRDLLDGKPFHLFQDQHQPVSFIQSFQKPLHVLPRFQLLADVRPGVLFFPRSNDLSGLFLTQIGFVQQRTNFLLSQ